MHGYHDKTINFGSEDLENPCSLALQESALGFSPETPYKLDRLHMLDMNSFL